MNAKIDKKATRETISVREFIGPISFLTMLYHQTFALVNPVGDAAKAHNAGW